MILRKNQTIIKFNGGDIGIGIRNDGAIGFQEIQQQRIGTKVKNNNTIFPVIFEFKNTKSIDVVIKQLKIAKKIIKNKRK